WPAELLALYVAQRTSLVRLAYLAIGDRETAEELVQDAFVATHRHWAAVRRPSAYVRAAVINRCRSWTRRQVMERERRPEPAEPAMLEADELWDALQKLDATRRTAIVLRYYEDRSSAEIAAIIGCRPVTVRTAIHRGLRQLRREIER
ncbi:MAG: sigma-70 family RNA polymerase sigma factor, partial [Acidimicrobiales bacterium]